MSTQTADMMCLAAVSGAVRSVDTACSASVVSHAMSLLKCLEILSTMCMQSAASCTSIASCKHSQEILAGLLKSVQCCVVHTCYIAGECLCHNCVTPMVLAGHSAVLTITVTLPGVMLNVT